MILTYNRENKISRRLNLRRRLVIFPRQQTITDHIYCASVRGMYVVYLFCTFFFGPRVIKILIYVDKLMYQPQWSMFRHGQCFGVVDLQVWVIFQVPQGMSHAGILDISPWSMPCQSQSLKFIRKCQICTPLYRKVIKSAYTSFKFFWISYYYSQMEVYF